MMDANATHLGIVEGMPVTIAQPSQPGVLTRASGLDDDSSGVDQVSDRRVAPCLVDVGASVNEGPIPYISNCKISY